MIEGWREAWGQGNFPFLWVQLSSIGKRRCIGETRDGMRRTLALPDTGMAVSFDLTNNDILPCKKPGDLHPSYCYEQAAARLARAARAVVYGEEIVWSGPLLEKAEAGDGKIVLSFTHVGDGLVVKKGKKEGLYGFEVQEKVPDGTLPGDEGEFKPVAAALGPERKKVVLDVKGLTAPFRVRYAYGDIPKGNLYNDEELPASPFISDPVK
jgi:sialate O-acetylesterase